MKTKCKVKVSLKKKSCHLSMLLSKDSGDDLSVHIDEESFLMKNIHLLAEYLRKAMIS